MSPHRLFPDGARVVALIVALAGVSTQARAETPPSCTPANQAQIAELSGRWNTALAACNTDALVGLYTEDAVLLPLLSDQPHTGRAEIRTYFEAFTRRHPQGQINMRSIMVGCNAASVIGTYVYRLTGRRKGTRVAIAGRYSTHYTYRDGLWLIALHDTSTTSTGAHSACRAAFSKIISQFQLHMNC